MRVCSLLTLISVLFFAAREDTGTGKIPNKLFLTGMVLTGLDRILEPAAFCPADCFITAAAVTGTLLLYLTGRMGGGDIKMFCFILLLFPGYEGVRLIWLSLLFSALGGLYGLVCSGSRKVRLGPGMLLAAVSALIYGGLK